MADIIINITIPDAFTQRLQTAIDHLDPLSGIYPTPTYKQQIKNLMRLWIKEYIVKSETTGGIFIDDGIVA